MVTWHIKALMTTVTLAHLWINAPKNAMAIDARDFGEAEAREAADVLDMLSVESRANFERIKEWKGVLKCEDKFYLTSEQFGDFARLSGIKATASSPVLKRVRAQVTFAVNLPNSQLFSEFHELDTVFREISSDRIINFPTLPFWQKSIVGVGQCATIEPEQRYGQFELAPDTIPDHGKAAFIDPEGIAKEMSLSTIIDPSDAFELLSTPAWDLMTSYAHMLRLENMPRDAKTMMMHDGVSLSVQKNSDSEYVITFTTGAGERRSQHEFVFAETSGFNPIRHTVSNAAGQMVSVKSIEYEKIDDIHVPSRWRLASPTKDGQHWRFQRILEREQQDINKPIEPATFDLIGGLGLSEGDRVVNRIENAIYVVQDEALVAAPQRSTTLRDMAAPEHKGIFIAINIGAIAVLLALIAYWRVRAR